MRSAAVAQYDRGRSYAAVADTFIPDFSWCPGAHLDRHARLKSFVASLPQASVRTPNDTRLASHRQGWLASTCTCDHDGTEPSSTQPPARLNGKHALGAKRS